MPREPLRGNPRHFFECSRFFEQMSGTGNDDQFLIRTLQPCQGLAIHRDDRSVLSSYDQQRRCTDETEGASCEIGPATAGDDRGNDVRKLSGRHERRARPQYWLRNNPLSGRVCLRCS